MTQPSLARLTLALAAATAAVVLAGPAPAGASPNLDLAEPSPGALLSTAVIGFDDVWAVGYQQPAPGTAAPLAEHWDGFNWRRTKTPSADGEPYGTLQSVAAVSSDDVWAVGYASVVSGGASTTLAEHWDGKHWTVVPTPAPEGSTWSALQSVTAVAAHNVWAVGYYYGGNGGNGGSVIEHWDGTSWSVVPSADPTGAYNANLTSVDAVSAHNVWAVGTYFDTSGAALTLTEHWDGTAWSLVDSPNPQGAPDAEFHAVSVQSRKSVWATGFTTINGSLFVTLIEHWDGTKWTIVKSPNPAGSTDSYLYGVQSLDGHVALATGYYLNAGTYQTLAEVWIKTKWELTNPPDLPGSNYLFGIDGFVTRSSTNVWAAGFAFDNQDVPFVEVYTGSWTLVPAK